MQKWPGQTVTVVPSIGRWVSVKDIPKPAIADEKNSYDVLAKFGSWKPFEGSDQVFVQHAMPCVTPDFKVPDGSPVIGLPMKGTSSPFAPNISIQGIRSGRRSAIIPASYEKPSKYEWIVGYDPDMKPLYANDEKPQFFLRLKGCGMWLQSTPFEFPGITIQPLPSVHFPGIDTVEIRGTAFPATVSNEMYTCPEITRMFDLLGLRHVNEPMGFWCYAALEKGDPCPTIPKCCSIFKTVADRRLETNILYGLERMILNVLTPNEAKEAYDRICEVYKQADYEPPSHQNTAYMKAQLLWKYPIDKFIAEHQYSTEGGEISTLTPKTIRSRGILPSSETYKALEGLKIGNLPLTNLAKTFGRLAWEAGRIIACVHRAGFNWGSYKDHTDNGMLDNAHADNLVLLPWDLADLGQGKYQLLSGLDFDMSFRKEQSVNIWGEKPVPDEKLVSKIFSLEFSNMLLNLTGYTASVERAAKGITPRDPKEITPNLELIWALRYLSIWEYPQGYAYPGKPALEENDLKLEEAIPFLQYAVDHTLDVSS